MRVLVINFLLVFLSCKEQATPNKTKPIAAKSKVETLDIRSYNELKPLLHKVDNTIHVVNFWATWCAPCVKELPYFETIQKTFKDKEIEVTLVSLDFPNQYNSKLKPFIQQHQLKSKIVALDDTDQNRWIPAIDTSWSGALPATLIYKGEKRKFFEKSFTQEELNAEIQQFLN